MKKYLSLISFLILSFVGFTQTIPALPSGMTIQQQGPPAPGGITITPNIYGPGVGLAYRGSFSDTTAANVNSFYKNIAGMTIRTGNTLWIRDTSKLVWLEFGSGSLVTDTSNSIAFGGLGSAASPLTAHVRVSPNPGNQIQILPNGVYSTTAAQVQNGLMSGGLVIWETGLTYTVTAATYAIGGIIYTSPETQVTLDNADPTNNRIDGFIVTTSGTATDLTGTPSTDPQNPSYDPATQLPLTFVLVTAASTEPTYCRDSLYYPNNGNTWATSVSNVGRINTTSTNNPYSVTQDVEFTAAINGDQLRFDKTGSATLSTYGVFAFKIRSKGAWASTSYFTAQWYNNLTPLGVPVAIGDNTPYGFNSSNAATYQSVVIPIGNFGVTTAANALVITVVNLPANTIGFYLDNVELLGCDGSTIPTSGSFWNTVGNSQGTTLFGGTRDNFPVQMVANNLNHTRILQSGSTWYQGTNPGLSFQLGTFAASDYFWRRSGTDLITNTAGTYLTRYQGNTVYSFIAASGHIWNSSAAAFNMQLNQNGNLLLGTNATNATTIFQVNSTTKASHPFPTMTTAQKNAIVAPQEGDLVYDDDLDAYYYYDAGWQPFGGQVTATNGLSISAGSNVVLGGSALTGNTSILTSAFSLTVNSSNATEAFAVNNTSSGGNVIVSTAVNGGALYATNTGSNGEPVITAYAAGNNTGVLGLSESGYGVSAYSTNTSGLLVTSFNTANPTVLLQKNATSNNTVEEMMSFRRFSGGSPANGIGVSVVFRPETTINDAETSNTIISKWTNATSATRTSEFSITGVNSATTGTILTIAGNGAMTLGAAYQGLGAGYLAVSNAGVVTWSAGGGGGGGDALTANPLSQFAATTSAQLAGVISDETGTGLLVFGTSPTLTTPVLGTPTSVTLTNATGLPVATGISGLGTGVATALAVNTGSAGAFVLFNGALGTPTSGTVSTGVTLGDVTMNVTGADATGDIYYRSAGGLLTRLAIGTNGQLLRTSAGGLPEWFTSGGGTGTVTSITLTQPSAGITITNSGVAATTVGTFTFALSGDLAGVEGLATTGIVRRTGTNTWTAGTLVSLNTEVTGTLPVANGGTGQTSYTAGQLLIGNGSTLTKATLTGTANQINVTNGAGSITLSMAFNPTEQTLTDGATVTWNVTNGGNSVWTNNSTGRTLTLSNLVAGYSYTLRLIQGSGGSKTVTTWTNVRWANGTAPTLSTTAGQTDMITFYAVSATSLVGYFTPNVQ